MSFPARIVSWSLAVLLLILAAGCGGNSFVGRRYDNFTAYYNTFYNAEQAYQAGVQAMEVTNEPLDRQRYLTIFGGPPRSGGHTTFQDAVEKSADVLREHPRSKWVDDALMLIGKSYFYQENFVGAEQKFREAIGLGTAVEDEARIWLARTLIAAGALEDAREHLATSLEAEDVSGRWTPSLHIALGELYVRQEAFEDAAIELEAGLEDVRDNDLRARASFLLGQVYETLGRYEDAVAAYGAVRSSHPRYELSYAADLSAVRVMGLHVDAEAALGELRRMERDDKNYANRFELAHVRGQIYQSMGRSYDARSVYYDILYDRESQVGNLGARVHYSLGKLYEEAFEDYLVAAAHYDTARAGLSTSRSSRAGSDTEPLYAPEAIEDAEARSEMFRSFATVRMNVARMDSLLELGSLGDEEFAQRILEIRRQKAVELAEQQRLAEQLQAERGFQNAASRSGGAGQANTTRADNSSEAGFLFHRDPIRVQEARMSFLARWGERPLVPNWRRSEAIAASTADAGDQPAEGAGGVRGIDPSVGENPLPEVDYSDVPRDSLSRAAMAAERAAARYELGNVLFLSMNRPDSAAAWYRMVIEEAANEEVAQRAYYALAEVQSSLGDTASANRLYEQVLRENPDSDFADVVRERLGREKIQRSDSLTTALRDYDEAFARWRRGFYADAMDRMVSIAADHRTTEVAPKALLAAGRIFLEWAEADSLDVFGPLPVTVADSVLRRAGLVEEAVSAASDSLAVPADSAASASAVPGEGGTASSPQRRIEQEAEGTPPGGVRRRLLAEDEAATMDEVPEERLRQALDGDAGVVEDASGDTPPLDERADVPVSPASADALPDSSRSESVLASADSSEAAEAEAGLLAPTDESGGQLPSGLLASAQETEEAEVYLESLYASVRDKYPSTPYSKMASEMLKALDQRLAEMKAEADSIAAAVAAAGKLLWSGADSLGLTADYLSSLERARAEEVLAAESATGDSLVAASAADSLVTLNASTDSDSTSAQNASVSAEPEPDVEGTAGGAVQADDAPREADASAAEVLMPTQSVGGDVGDAPEGRAPTENDPTAEVPSGDASLRGEGGIRQELGGFTIVIGMNVQYEPMKALAQRYAEQGFRTDVLTEQLGSTTLYRAAIGHFPTGEAASMGLEVVNAQIEEGGQIAPLTAR